MQILMGAHSVVLIETSMAKWGFYPQAVNDSLELYIRYGNL